MPFASQDPCLAAPASKPRGTLAGFQRGCALRPPLGAVSPRGVCSRLPYLGQRLRRILPFPSKSQSIEICSLRASWIRKSVCGVVPLS